MLGQTAHFCGCLLIQAVDVRENLEEQEEITLSGSKIEAPGTEIAARSSLSIIIYLSLTAI
jgi:hypothetical protein